MAGRDHNLLLEYLGAWSCYEKTGRDRGLDLPEALSAWIHREQVLAEVFWKQRQAGEDLSGVV